MRDRTRHTLAALTVIAGGLAGVTACADDSSDTAPPSAADTTLESPAAPQPTTSITTPDATDTMTADPLTTDTAPTSTIADSRTSTRSDLDADDIARLVWLREEEQLAHDVYATLAELWDLRIFDNISASEENHIAAVFDLLDRYGIDDPAAGNPLGQFNDPQLQALYDQFVADGSASLAAALQVGATIEELDIADLRELADAVDQPDVLSVAAELERGSRNHLRAFVGQLTARDAQFEPTHLDAAVFTEIVSSPTERGH
jgi:hypothetical protein